MTPPPLTGFLYDQRAADREPVTVFDIGCSGGIFGIWNVFGKALRGTGFDPSVPEIERLRSVETRSNVTYEAGCVGLKPADRELRAAYEAALPKRLRGDSSWFLRSSAYRAAQLTAFDHARESVDAGRAPRYSERLIAIDDYVRETGSAPDILKIDTDGGDMEVLLGADDTIGASVLAIHIECDFHGSLSKYANSLPTIDAFLRERGLKLYTMEPFRYTRAALPSPFATERFAQTRSGQLAWADILYVRDLAVPEHEGVYGFAVTPERVLKTAAVMELFGLQDCAAELLQARAAALPYATETLLDLLVPPYLGNSLSHREYVARFEADPAALLPSRVPVLPIPTARPMQPIDLGQARSEPEWGADLRHDAPGITVTTGAARWAYAARIPLRHDERPSSVELDVSVVAGRIWFMLEGDGGVQVSEQAWLDADRGAAVVALPVPAGTVVTAVIVRNGDGGSPSTASITAARLLGPVLP